MFMDLFICNLCLKSSKQKYRLFQGKTLDTTVYTDLGRKLHACTELTVPSNIQTVCKQCRDAIIQVRNAQIKLEQRVNDLKTKIQSVSITTPVSTSKRTLSPTSTSTGLSPAAKRLHPAHAARELFPRNSLTASAENQSTNNSPSTIDKCRYVPGQLFTAKRLLPLIMPKPAAVRVPLSSHESERVPKRLIACSPSRIPVRETIATDDTNGTTVKVRYS